MRLHRFFIDKSEIKEGIVSLPQDHDLTHQWIKVFRYETGDQVILLDNSGVEYVARFLHAGKKEVKLEIVEQRENSYRAKRKVTLCVALIKKDNFETILQKGTELGVTDFIPVLAERSEKKNLNAERAKVILKEASEQSGKATIPMLHEVMKLEEVIEKNDTNGIVFDPSGKKFEKSDIDLDPIVVYIGPEGGWSEKELALFKARNINILSLGDAILRAETAAIAVSSLLLL